MARDELNEPLGYDPDEADPAPRAQRRTLPWRTLAWGGCGLLAAGLGAFAALTNPDADGEPRAVAAVVTPPKIEPRPQPPAPAAAPETTGAINITRRDSNGDEIEYQNGVKVVRRGGGGAPGALVIQVPESSGVRLSPAPDRRLVEKGKYGPLPRVGADGSRPGDIYARPLVTASGVRPGAPRIAMLVGGLGLASGPTQEAIEKLPEAVSLGFAPYGPELEPQAAQARAAGHEIFLQAPMEPFDSLQSDPGPHTLRADAEPSQTLDDLHWLMSRFSGYAGVANFLGARFSANRPAFEPVLSELNARGLIYVDDGASPQSLAPALAPALGLPLAKADLVIDLDRKPEAILAALTSLEAIARAKGQAFGVASALPATLEQVGRFARSLERRGIVLVPVSALASRQPKTLAERP